MSRKRIAAGLGAVAFALAACQGGVEGQTGSPSLPALPSEMPSGLESMAPPSGLESLAPSPSNNQLFPVFQASAGFDLTGGAIVTDVDGESSVVIGVVAPSAVDIQMPAAIVDGDCATQQEQGPIPPPDLFPSPDASPGAGASPGSEAPGGESPPIGSPEPSLGASPGTGGEVTYPIWLTPIAVGSSNSVIQAGVEDLVASPHAIVIEESADNPRIVACADLQEGPPTQASPDASLPASSPGSVEMSPGTSPETSP
jgi:hypothetical protein